MSTTTPATRPVTTLDTLPRPRISLAAWAKLWFAPETARQQFAAFGERFTLDVPLLPTMLWTSSPRRRPGGLPGEDPGLVVGRGPTAVGAA